MQKYIDAAFSSRPVMPLKGAEVTVTTSNGDLATLYSDNAGTLMGNPIYTDDGGNYSFYAADGRYTITITKTGFQTQVLADVLLEDPSDQVADLAALQLADYAALRQYTGPRQSVYVTGYLGTANPSGIAGMFVRDDSDSSTADNGGTVIVSSNGKRWKRAHNGTVMPQHFGIQTLEQGASSPAANATALEALRQIVEAYKLDVYWPSGTYVFPPGIRMDADNTSWTFASGALVKLQDAQATGTDFVIFSAPTNQRVYGLRVDANRSVQNATTFGADRCAVLVTDANGCLFDSVEIVSSPAKGFGLVPTAGNTVRDVAIRNFKGSNCVTQVLIVDGNNITGFFERIVIAGVRIGATSHGGLVINDGAHNIAVSDVISDVQNSTWDAVDVRDSWDIQLSNVRGSRGRNGVYLQRLNGFCGRIQMDNVVGERSSQNGVLMAGVENVTGGVVIGRNNVGAGINVTTGPSSYRCKNIAIAAPSGIDDQGTPTQQYGLLIQGVDGCQLGKHIAYGNTTRNVSINRASTSAVDANVRQVASITTGSIASSSQAVVTATWGESFEDTSIDLEAIYVSEGTSSLALSIGHVVAVTTAAVQVMVKNLSGTTAHTGTLTVIGRRTV